MMSSFTNQNARSPNSNYEFEPMFAHRAAPSGASRRKALSEEDLAAAHAAGVAEGVAQTQASLSRSSSDSLRAIASLMQMMLGRLHEEAQSLRTDAAEVALTAAKVVAGCALDRFGDDGIAAIVSTATAQLRDVPRLVVRVAPQLVSDIEDKLQTAAREAGFQGEVAVRGQEGAQLGDCTLDWGNGAIIHDRAAAFAAIEQAGADWLASAAAQGPQIDLFDQ